MEAPSVVRVLVCASAYCVVGGVSEQLSLATAPDAGQFAVSFPDASRPHTTVTADAPSFALLFACVPATPVAEIAGSQYVVPRAQPRATASDALSAPFCSCVCRLI